MNLTKKIILSDKDLPTKWYNLLADIKNPPAPMYHPVTKKVITSQDLEALFPKAIIEQENSRQRWIEIPDQVQDILRIWRPSPLYRATALEKALDTPAHIYYKWEGVSPAGSHKTNTSIPQAYYNKQEGIKRLATETGAGQWGSSLSLAGAMFGLDVKVYMVKVSYNQKPYRTLLIKTWGGEVISSPSDTTEVGRKILAQDPDNQGSLGIAISEAVEDALRREDTHYALGSVLNHVCLHQTIIGLETQKQLELFDEQADIVIGCHGGGSNLAGIAFPFIGDNLTKATKTKIIASEPASCPSLTKGEFTYDFCDNAGMIPIAKMYTLGSSFIPPGVHVGGLRYHAAAPLVSQMVQEGYIEARAEQQTDCFKAATLFTRTEGFLPAPESSHAIKTAIDEAKKCKESGEKKVIVFNLTGHGHFDLVSYEKFFNGELNDFDYPEKEIKDSLKKLPKIN